MNCTNFDKCKNEVLEGKTKPSKWCSDGCRKDYNRAEKTDKKENGQAGKKKTDKSINTADWMTQEQIEEHYTLKNYPPVKYYSLNGGGAGSYSPYPKSNPKSRAYEIR